MNAYKLVVALALLTSTGLALADESSEKSIEYVPTRVQPSMVLASGAASPVLRKATDQTGGQFTTRTRADVRAEARAQAVETAKHRMPAYD